MDTLKICGGCGLELAPTSTQGLCPACRTKGGNQPSPAADVPPTSSPRFTAPHPIGLAPWFPQLEILGLIGQGGMGAVYKARQRGLDRLVALKILPPQIAGDPDFAERFAREARTMARLNHPNVVDIYDLGQAGPLYYFLMEFVDGVNLRQLLESHQLTPREALALMPQICEALEYAHGEGVVHRDIKPENILLDQKGCVKITDFGLSKLLQPGRKDVQLTQAHHVLGTMHYIAPEQFENPLTADHRADIYSLGVVMYEMLTGELPLGRFELPSKKSAVDARLDELVLHALEQNPERRFQQASDVRVQLETIAGISSRLSPEASRKMSYEYRSKATLFGWPLLHIATGVDPTTGRRRSAKGIIAVGTAPRGFIAFGDVAVGVIACGIFCYGPIAIGVVSMGIFAVGSVAVGLLMAMGGVAFAPVAIGGAVFGYYANGAIVWAIHGMGPGLVVDPLADKFFNPWIGKSVRWVFTASLICMPVFLALGLVPALMAKLSERRRKRSLQKPESP